MVRRERGVWRYIIEEIEQREGERRQELAEKAVTRVLLMCNETLHRGRDNRKDRRMEGDRDEKGEEECGCDGAGEGRAGEQAEAGTQKGIMSFVK